MPSKQYNPKICQNLYPKHLPSFKIYTTQSTYFKITKWN